MASSKVALVSVQVLSDWVGQSGQGPRPTLTHGTHLAEHDQQTRFTAGTITDDHQLSAKLSHTVLN